MPDTIDLNACRKGRSPIDKPAGKVESIGFCYVQRVKHRRNVRRYRMFRAIPDTTVEEMRQPMMLWLPFGEAEHARLRDRELHFESGKLLAT